MSRPPRPGRFEKKCRLVPSWDKNGAPSSYALLTTAPTLTGTDQVADVLARVATHMSIKPFPPSRSDVMKISRPSLRSHTRVSRFGLLSSATRTPGPNDAFARSLSVVEVR